MDNSRCFTAFHLSHEKTPRTKLRELGHRITGHCVVFGRPRPRLYGTAVAPLGWIGWEVVCFKLKGFAFGTTAFQPGSCRTLVSFRLGRGHFLIYRRALAVMLAGFAQSCLLCVLLLPFVPLLGTKKSVLVSSEEVKPCSPSGAVDLLFP